MRLFWLFALVPTLVGCGPACADSAAALEAALAAAGPGDVVCVGDHRIEGTFEVPDGVRLTGSGADRSVLASADGEPVVQTTSATMVTIDHLGIDVAHGGVGVRGAGAGTLVLEDVAVTVTRGLGVGLDACSAELTSVTLAGPIDATNASSAGSTPTETGAYGIVGRSLDVRTVTLTDVTVRGFAVAGATFGGGTVVWNGRADGPDVEASRGIGIAFFGSHAELRSVEVRNILSAPTVVGVGVAAIGAGSFHADGLSVHGGVGFGLFAQSTAVVLTDASFADLALAGVRIQSGSLEAHGLTASANGGAGVLAIDTSAVTITDATITDQRRVLLPSGITAVQVGDGIQVVRDALSPTAPALSLELTDVVLSGNARTGILLDAADGPVGGVLLQRVSVDAPTGATGAIAQRAAVPASWDAAVLRTGAAVDDGSFSGVLDPVGIMMPPGSAPPDF